ncbi:MAG: hypothetical protein RL338_780, partial [Chloroflexota bacterium]
MPSPAAITGLASRRPAGRRLAAIVGGTVLALAVAVAAIAALQVLPPGPLARVSISETLNCAVQHEDDALPSFFEDTACGTFLAVGGTVFGPADIPAGPLFEPFTPISESSGGTGTPSDPYRIQTVVDTTAGLRITQLVTYTSGDDRYRTDITVANLSNSAASAELFLAADCYLQDSDFGFGLYDSPTETVSCVSGVETAPDVWVPGTRLESLIPISTGSDYYYGDYAAVWDTVLTGDPLPNLCDQCDAFIDNGIALSWSFNLPKSATATRSLYTRIAPTGRVVAKVTKSADAPAATDGTIGYTITVTNPTASAITLDTIVDTLPAGFSYAPGTTTGATTGDAVVDGSTATWAGPFPVTAGGTTSIHFTAAVEASAGVYLNYASATSSDAEVVPSGGTAPVIVGGATLTLVKVVENSGGGTATSGDWGLSAVGDTLAAVVAGASGTAAVTDRAVPPDTYLLSESGGPSGYVAGEWACSGAAVVGGYVDVTAGANVECTVTNTYAPPPMATITLTKVVENSGGGTASSGDWTLVAYGFATDTLVEGASGTPAVTAVEVPAGSYELGEYGGPTDYSAGTWECSGGTAVDSYVEVAAGAAVSCTITNTYVPPETGTLTLVKLVENSGGGTASTGDWTLVAEGMSATVSGTSGSTAVTAVDVPVGGYVLSETGGPADYAPGAWICVGASATDYGSGVGLVDISAGASVSCTITNTYSPTQPATLTLVKLVDNSAGGSATAGDWILGADGPTPIAGISGADTVTDASVSEGTYALSESGGPGDYTGGTWTCTNGESGDVVFVASGEDVTCTITNTYVPAASDVANAIITPSVTLVDASYLAIPAGTTSAGVATSGVGTFPRHGPTYGVLTTGRYSSVFQPGTFASGNLGAVSTRGDTAFDATVLEMQILVPPGATCLAVDFTFLSEEYPGFVGSDYNDAFIAEIGTSDWSTNGASISAPHNFAFDAEGDVVSINSTGLGQMSGSDGTGTAFDGVATGVAFDGGGGATVQLTARTPVTPGVRTVFFSVFDQSDHVLDTAVFLDNLRSYDAGGAACGSGAILPGRLTLTKLVDNTGGGTAEATAWTLSATGPTTISGVSGSVAVTAAEVSAGSYQLAESGGPAGYVAGSWSCTGGALDGSTVEVTAGATVDCEITNTHTPTLTASRTGSGAGTIASDPAGIDCGASCSADFTGGSTVTLSAEASAGSVFTGWTGCDSTSGPGGSTCTVTMDGPRTASAGFDLVPVTLSVETSGTGAGTITSVPAGIDCGATCSAGFTDGSVVVLTATAVPASSAFAGWSGCDLTAGTDGSVCTVTMTAARSVSAAFVHVDHLLTVGRAGIGEGSVVADVGAIDCGATCSDEYTGGTTVVLTATPAITDGTTYTFTFAGWSGCDSTSGTTCTVTLLSARSVTATFGVKTVVIQTFGGPGTIRAQGGGPLGAPELSTDVSAGTYEVTFASGSDPAPSGNPRLGPSVLVVDITVATSDGTLAPPYTICIAGAPPQKLWHFEGGAWKNITNSPTATPPGYADGKVCGTATSLSPFAVALAAWDLSVFTAGDGAGTVERSVLGTGCGAGCRSYTDGTSVTLTATPASGSVFSGWSGGGCSGTDPCTVVMTEVRLVTATFSLSGGGGGGGFPPGGGGFIPLPPSSGPTITVQPANRVALAGRSVTFSVSTGDTGATFRWERSRDGSTWTEVSGATSRTYTFTAAS